MALFLCFLNKGPCIFTLQWDFSVRELALAVAEGRDHPSVSVYMASEVPVSLLKMIYQLL